MGRIDGASWNNKRPAGVARAFQVKEHSVERQADDASNVFAKEPSGSDLCNKPMQLRPEVAVIRCGELPPRDGKRLAGEAAGPEFGVVRPARETRGVGETGNAAEEMALGEVSHIIRLNISY